VPVYEYTCPDCGENFEKLVRSSDTSPVRCPKCDSEKVKKKLSKIANTNRSSSNAGSVAAGAPTCAPGGG